MARYIDAELLFNALKEEHKKGNFVFTSKWIKEIIDDLPTADVVPKSEVERMQTEIESLNDCKEGAVWRFDPPVENFSQITGSVVARRYDEKTKIFHQFLVLKEPKIEGVWVSNRQTDEYICSLCGMIAPVDCLKEKFYESNFCPNCGAKMSKGDMV